MTSLATSSLGWGRRGSAQVVSSRQKVFESPATAAKNSSSAARTRSSSVGRSSNGRCR
jgi:hypothetical protein